MAKGEIACFEQFLLLSLYFQELSAAEASESVFMRERVKARLFRFYFHITINRMLVDEYLNPVNFDLDLNQVPDGC